MIIDTLKAQLALVKRDHLQNPSVMGGVQDVEVDIRSNRRIAGWGADWAACYDWSAADAGAIARARFKYSCEGWAEDLRGSLLRLSSVLRTADDFARAEVISSIAGETLTAVEQSDQVVGDPYDWSKATPWYAYLGIGAGALLLWKVVDDG